MQARHTTVAVTTIPACDLDPGHGPAYADARIPGGGWGNVCRPCFDRFGCSLGLGHGQELTER
jgi:hypothetical protein